jgi:hypothetical protein
VPRFRGGTEIGCDDLICGCGDCGDWEGGVLVVVATGGDVWK